MLVLFLLLLGNVFTGMTVKDINSLTLKDYPAPFIKNNAPNNLYIIIPSSASDLEKDSALKIAQSLDINPPIHTEIITDKEVPKGLVNLILVGSPCNNEQIAKELEINKCNPWSESGFIKLINKGKTSMLIISGDLKKSTKVITHPNFYPLRGNEILIKGEENLLLSYY
jgi:hypothetical protein